METEAALTDSSSPSVRRFAGLPVEGQIEIQAREGVGLGLYGSWGGGKTPLAATAIDYFRRTDSGAKALFLDCEGGLKSIRSRLGVSAERIVIETWAQFEKVTDAFISEGEIPWPVVIVDHITELAELSMDNILRQKRKAEPEWQEWRLNSRLLTGRIKKLRDLARLRRTVLIVVVQDRDSRDDAGNLIHVGLGLNPALAKQLGSSLDVVSWLEVVDQSKDAAGRVLHLGGTSRVQARARFDQADPVLASIPLDIYTPSLEPLVAAIIGGEPWPKDPKFLPPQTGRRSRFDSGRPATPTAPSGASSDGASTE